MKKALLLLASMIVAAPALATPSVAQDGDAPLARPAPSAKPSAKPAKPAKPAAAAQQSPAPTPPAATPPAPASAQQIPPAPQGVQNQQPPAGAEIMAPVEQAQKAGLTTCLPLLKDLSSLSIDGAHATLSTWHKDAPAQRGYSALTAMQYGNAIAPNAIAMEVVAPVQGNKCDGGFMRVHPSKLSCAEIAQGLAKDKNMPAPDKMNSAVSIYPANSVGQRLVLMDAPSSGCIVISNAFYFSQ